MKKYYNIKTSQQEQEKMSILLLKSISDLDSAITEVLFAGNQIPSELADKINKRLETAKIKISQAFERANQLGQ
jgi:hypothetical protein